MRRGAPFSMGSTVRDDPRRSGHLRGALYASRMTGKNLGSTQDRQLDLARSRCTVHQLGERDRARSTWLFQIKLTSDPRPEHHRARPEDVQNAWDRYEPTN